MMTCGWESRPTNAVAGRSGPSLAGLAATSGPKRRQGSCGVRAGSPERMKVVEAEAVPVAEGRMCAVAKRDGDAPPGSKAASRTKASVGSAHSTDDAAEGNEASRGEGPARRDLAPGGQGPDAGPGILPTNLRSGGKS